MADHSQKWHDGTSTRNIKGSSNSEGIAAIINKLETLSRDMKKLKENVHAIQVGCQICEGAHIDKDCPLNEEVKSVEEVKYGEFGFSNNEKQETDNSGMTEALATLEATLKIKKEEPKEEKQKFRKTDNYAKYMKELVENKPRTEEYEEIRMNPRCSALLRNHLPPKEQDPGSFILHCSIGKLDFNNALADLGASISVMPLSMYKRLGIGKLEPINIVIEMADNTKCTPKGIVENLLIKIVKFMFPVDFVILNMVEDLRMPIILGIPLLATAHAKVDIFRKSISLEVGSEKVIFKMRKIVYRIIEVEKEKQSRPKERRVHWFKAILQEKENRSEYGKICKMTKERILKDHWRDRIGDKEDDLKENLEDPKECREDKANTIMGAIHNKLNEDWFNNTSEDEDDLEGILDYLEPRSYDGFINLDDEDYNKRRCKLLGITYKEPTLILMEKVKVTRYTIGPGEIYTKIKVLGVDEKPRTRDNIAAIRARLIEKMAHEGNGQAKT
ncbi:zinc knuckle CX2CX4HX4C containing protein [Tanacetum coccineum]